MSTYSSHTLDTVYINKSVEDEFIFEIIDDSYEYIWCFKFNRKNDVLRNNVKFKIKKIRMIKINK